MEEVAVEEAISIFMKDIGRKDMKVMAVIAAVTNISMTIGENGINMVDMDIKIKEDTTMTSLVKIMKVIIILVTRIMEARDIKNGVVTETMDTNLEIIIIKIKAIRNMDLKILITKKNTEIINLITITSKMPIITRNIMIIMIPTNIMVINTINMIMERAIMISTSTEITIISMEAVDIIITMKETGKKVDNITKSTTIINTEVVIIIMNITNMEDMATNITEVEVVVDMEDMVVDTMEDMVVDIMVDMVDIINLHLRTLFNIKELIGFDQRLMCVLCFITCHAFHAANLKERNVNYIYYF